MVDPLPRELGTERVAAVVVNWNGGGKTARAVDSLRRSDHPVSHCVVIDNASTDGSELGLRDLLPTADFDLVVNPTNRGFAAAANQGLALAAERGCDFAFLLNNDAWIEASTIGELVAAARRNRRAGLLAPKILSPDGRVWCAGVDIGWHANLQRLRGFGRADSGAYDRESEVDAVTGCGLLVTRALLDVLGGFDERYFVYVEDVDLSLAAREAGFTSVYAPRARMVHEASSSSGGGYGAWRKHMVAYNLVQLLKKRGDFGLWSAFVVIEILAWPLLMISALPRGRGAAALAKARGFAKALCGRPFERPLPPRVESRA